MELKVGQTIYAINECVMDDEKKTLTIGKGYVVYGIDGNGQFMVYDDEGEKHYFPKDDVATFFTTEPPKTERYFIVFYDGNTDIGYCEVITTDGQYISQTQAREAIKEHVGHENHSITNIIELNQQDYESWNK